MKILLIFLLFGSAAFAQEGVDHLLERNLFEPERGQKEDDSPEEEEVVPISKDMPVFDGTVFIGDTKIAMFTYMLEGKQTSASIQLNEMVGGYTLTAIDRTKVELRGGGSSVPLQLFSIESGQKTKRGGTKTVSKVKKPPRAPSKAKSRNNTKGNSKGKDDKGRIKPSDPKKDTNKKGGNRADKNKKPSRFPKRTPPKNRSNNKKKTGNLTNKF